MCNSLRTNTMKHSPIWEANRFPACQEIPYSSQITFSAMDKVLTFQFTQTMMKEKKNLGRLEKYTTTDQQHVKVQASNWMEQINLCMFLKIASNVARFEPQ